LRRRCEIDRLFLLLGYKKIGCGEAYGLAGLFRREFEIALDIKLVDSCQFLIRDDSMIVAIVFPLESGRQLFRMVNERVHIRLI